MFVVVALVICIVIGIAGRGSRVERYGWIGAGIATLTLVIIAWAYHDDAQSLREFVTKRDDLMTRLRTNKICLDMETAPEHWAGAHLEYPCIGYGANELRLQIADQEDALEAWNRAIRDRQALLKARETGAFWFIQAEFGGTHE
jgi:hypothetical protein